jgi:hypothetical protein
MTASRLIYGALPEDLGLIDLSPVEMLFWMYCPIQTPSEGVLLPANLRQFEPIVGRVLLHAGASAYDKYVYLTAKTLWVEGNFIGNRPGWHSDGFGTDDVNYVWCDRAPTEFIEDRFTLPADCADAMGLMTMRAAERPVVTFPDKHLLRLTLAVIHRSPVRFAPGMRTFVKVSISPDRYNLEGNSVNHGIEERWPLLPRQAVRNHPATASADAVTRQFARDGQEVKS